MHASIFLTFIPLLGLAVAAPAATTVGSPAGTTKGLPQTTVGSPAETTKGLPQTTIGAPVATTTSVHDPSLLPEYDYVEGFEGVWHYKQTHATRDTRPTVNGVRVVRPGHGYIGFDVHMKHFAPYPQRGFSTRCEWYGPSGGPLNPVSQACDNDNVWFSWAGDRHSNYHLTVHHRFTLVEGGQ